MKKFDKAAIMKMGWEIKRKLNNTIGAALKMSWFLAKKAIEIKEDHSRPEGEVSFNIWANYGKVRAYYECSWRSKYQNGKGHFIAL